MTSEQASDSESECPYVICPDYEPLIHLTQIDALHILDEAADSIVILDVVKMQAMHFLDAACTRRLTAWLDSGATPESETPIEIRTTSTGRALAAARVADPSFQWRNITLFAVLDYMLEVVDDTSESRLYIYENFREYVMFHEYLSCPRMSLKDFLRSETGSDESWEMIKAVAPLANE